MGILTPSTQDYLKALRDLSKNGEAVRSADVAAAVGVSRASVSRAMGVLKNAGYIDKEKYGAIFLTKKGKETADAVKKNNRLIEAFLTDVLGVGWRSARRDACRMEHAISAETAGKLQKYLRERQS